MTRLEPGGSPGSLRHGAYHVIFESEPGWGRIFDVVLIGVILASVLVVMLESVVGIRHEYAILLVACEWIFTVLFTVEYVARVWCLRDPRAYVFSFFGIVDLLAVLPFYLGLLFPSGHFLAVIRILRVVRVFRILKLARYMSAAHVLLSALYASRYKISVFVVAIVGIVTVVGSLMYVIEGPENGFASIPSGIYWAIVTLTTVGFGDITPRTPLGRALASLVMILGYGIIAVPTGIITAELTAASRAGAAPERVCGACGLGGHGADARFCRGCAAPLPTSGGAP